MSDSEKNLFVGVNEPADVDNPSDLEKKHTPVIDAPDEVKAGECLAVTVEVGKLLAHPNDHDHFIQFVELYADETFLARGSLTSVKSCPKMTFCIALKGSAEELRAYCHCNMHGTWVGRKAVKIS